MKKTITVFLFLFFVGMNKNQVAAVPLTGTLTIPGNYTTIASAIADLNANGVGTGGVTFNVAAGHSETSSNLNILFSTDPSNASNPVVFQKSGTGQNPLITAAAGISATADGIIKISGGDYITFDGIDLVDPASNTGNSMMEWGYALLRASTTNGSTNNVIKNCFITLQKINTLSIGIYIANKDSSGVVVNGVDSLANNNENIIYGNTISNVYKGIQASASSTSRDLSNQIGMVGQNSNSITNWGGSNASCDGIRCEAQANVKVRNNVINGGVGTNGSIQITGIIITSLTTSTARNYEVSFNTITIVCGNTTGALVVIRALGSGDTISIHDNVIENCNLGLNTTGVSYIEIGPVGISNAGLIYNNILRNNSSSGTGSVSMITGGTGTAVTKLEIHDNQIYGNQKSGVSGSLIGISTDVSALNCYSNEIHDNSIPNSSGTSASSVYGYFNNGNALTSENVYNNNIYKLSVGGFNTSSSSIVAGIRTSGASLSKNIYENIIDTLSAVSGRMTSGGVVGIWNSSGTDNKIYRNKIFNLKNTGTLSTAAGCWVTTGTSNLVYNNFISNLQTPNSTDTNAVIGINSTGPSSNSTLGIFYNSIHLNASGGSSFGSSGVSVSGNTIATTGALSMSNNIIYNTSSPGSTSGKTVAFRRSNVNFQNFTQLCNHNLLYTGTPAANRLIFSNGGGNDQTLGDYQTRVAPRDSKAKSGTVNFVDANIGDLHITGASIQDILLCAKPLNGLILDNSSGITTDYDGAARDANNPYKGADESTAFPIKTLNLTINFEVCPMADTVDVLIRSVSPPYEVLDSARDIAGQGNSHSFDYIKVENGVNYYIVIKHRNSIETWSKSGGEQFTANALTYDFTTAASQAYNSNLVLSGSDYSNYTGDPNQDGIVDASDIVLIYNDATAVATGYVVTDLNCDNIVDASDILSCYNNSLLVIQIQRP